MLFLFSTTLIYAIGAGIAMAASTICNLNVSLLKDLKYAHLIGLASEGSNVLIILTTSAFSHVGVLMVKFLFDCIF
jgi:hypothetical protein